MTGIALFAASASAFAERLADLLGVPLGPVEETEFEDGERRVRPLAGVRGQDVFVIQSLHEDAEQSIDTKLLRLLLLVATLVDGSAERVTAVLPYLCYARQDQAYQPHDAVMPRHLARLFEAAGTSRVLAMEVHNVAAFQNAHRCRADHVDTAELFAQHFADAMQGIPLAVVSPDAGGIKRAERFQRRIGQALGTELPLAFMEKRRGDGIESGALTGDIGGRTAIIFDDMISTGATLLRAAQMCRARGATAVVAAAAHGIFAPGAEAVVADPAIDRIVITDSIAPIRLGPQLVQSKLTVLGAAPLFASAIRALLTSTS